MRKAKAENPSDNLLLAGLSKVSRERVCAKAQIVTVTVEDMLYYPGDTITAVYFPLSCVISLLTDMEDGSTIEIATIGNEGLLGLAVYLGIDVAVSRGITQVPGQALRLNVDDFTRAAKTEERLDLILRRYTHALLTQIARSGGCNSLHSVEERYARWLLMMHDRTNVDVFAFTQEFLSEMLGVSRARVNVVAGLLEKAGLVTHSRKQITVLDWSGLEASSCDCYRVIKEEFDRLRIY